MCRCLLDSLSWALHEEVVFVVLLVEEHSPSTSDGYGRTCDARMWILELQ